MMRVRHESRTMRLASWPVDAIVRAAAEPKFDRYPTLLGSGHTNQEGTQ